MPPTPQDDPSTIQGLPAGAVLKPISPTPVADDPSQVQGLPAGAVLKPMGSAGADTSTASTQTQPAQSSLGSRVWEGAKEYAAPIEALVSPPKTPTEQVVHAIGGGGGALAAYRMAKNLVGSVDNAVKAGPAQYKQAAQDVADAVQQFHNNDFRNALSSVVSAGAGMGVIPGGTTTRELSEGARPGGNLATPLTRDALTVGTAVLLQNPFRAAAAAVPEEAAAEGAAGVSKIEPAVAARAAKAGLAPGESGLTGAEAQAQTTQAAADARTATQVNTDQALQNIATRHATENGLPAPAAGTASRDVLVNNGNALVDAGKADYQTLDKFTNGKFTNAQSELKNAQLELQQKAGTTSADTPALEANVLRAQMNVDNLFDTAVDNGMDKNLADAARTKFRTGQATLDAGNAVRMANRVRGAAGERTTDLNVLENRWTALYDSGRLQQAFGEQGAKDALTQIHAARETGQIFSELPPTETQALKQLIADNTKTGKFGTSTNWDKVQDAFSKMPDKGARFSDVPKVEKFINNQVFYQHLRQGAGTAVKWGARAAAGATGAGLVYEGGKALFGE